MNYDSMLKNKIDNLLDVSPSDANASSRITKTKNGYLGILEIFSSQGKFIVEATGRDLDAMISSLFKLMYGQMKLWRTGRFSRELVLVPSGVHRP